MLKTDEHGPRKFRYESSGIVFNILGCEWENEGGGAGTRQGGKDGGNDEWRERVMKGGGSEGKKVRRLVRAGRTTTRTAERPKTNE